MPTLNIKNPRVYELAHELAEATGKSMTSVVEVALEQMLDRVRVRKQAVQDARRAAVEKLLEEMADRYGPMEDDPTAFLYDEETGLPRGD